MAKIGGWEVHLETMTPFWSEEVFRIHELPIDQPPGLEDALNFYTEEDRPKIEKLVNDAIENNKQWDEELRIRTAKGNLKWIRTIGKTVQNNENKIVGVKGVFQEITANKQVNLTCWLLSKQLTIRINAC
jgi:PAS domain-containing protein